MITIYRRRNCRLCSHGSWIARYKAKVFMAKCMKVTCYNAWKSRERLKETTYRQKDKYRFNMLRNRYWLNN